MFEMMVLAMSYLNETALAHIVNVLGDHALATFTVFIYKSPLTNLVITITGFIGVVHFAMNIRDGVFPSKILYFLMAWCFCFPVNQKPVGFILVDNFSKAIAITMEKASDSFFKSIEKNNGQRMPPWYLAKVFLKSSVVKVTDPQVQKAIHALADDCVPEPGSGLKNKVGDELSILELLLPLEATSGHGISTFKPRFGDEVIRALKERATSIEKFVSKDAQNKPVYANVNCWELIQYVHQETRKNIQETQKIMEDSQGNLQSTLSDNLGKYSTERNTFILNTIEPLIMNVAEANAKRIELAQYDESTNGFINSFGDANMVNLTRKSGLISEVSYIANNMFDATARYFNNEKGLSIAMKASDLSDRLLSLPYYVAAIQLILKIIAPLVFLTLLFGMTKFFTSWAMMWLTTLLFPIVTNFCGSFLNLMMVIKGKLNLIAKNQSYALEGLHNHLMFNINYEAIDKITQDFNRLIDVFLSLEIAIIAIMSSILLAGSWFGERYVSSFASLATSVATNSFIARASQIQMPSAGKIDIPKAQESPHLSTLDCMSFTSKLYRRKSD